MQKKATVVVVAFFVELHCYAAPHYVEEGDGSNAAIAFFFFFFSCNTKKKPLPSFASMRCSATLPCGAQLHKQTNKQINKRKMLYLGKMLTWVPRGSCSGSSRSPIPSSPAPSSLPLDVFGALAME
jgi:hypothetical protein